MLQDFKMLLQDQAQYHHNGSSECDWTIKDVMKGSETSKAIVGFNYDEKMVGTIELGMIKEDKIWKIDSLAMPKIDKFTLAQGTAVETE